MLKKTLVHYHKNENTHIYYVLVLNTSLLSKVFLYNNDIY